MIHTVLIDLDDTLLDNSMERFLPAYFQRLGDYLSDVVDPKRMLPALMAGTQAMLTNSNPTTRLERRFADVYYPDLSLDENSLGDRIKQFYAEIFPQLEPLTAVRPDARDFIETLFANGLEVVIATNPLFPRLAIEERLRWAQIPTDEFKFSLVTSYEIFHFTKTTPAYYAEILGLMGRSPSEAVMIGNDVSMDLEPAHRLGMPVFHLHAYPTDHFPGGDFSAAASWLETIQPSDNLEAVKQPESVLARLKSHLSALLTMANACDDDLKKRRPAADEWAPIEIIAHFADVELEVNLPRLRLFMDDPDPHLPAFDTDSWAQERGYIDYPFKDTLERFVETRLQLIAGLETLKADDWLRSGVHALLGPITLAEVMNITVEHDLLHLAQMRTTIGYPP